MGHASICLCISSFLPSVLCTVLSKGLLNSWLDLFLGTLVPLLFNEKRFLPLFHWDFIICVQESPRLLDINFVSCWVVKFTSLVQYVFCLVYRISHVHSHAMWKQWEFCFLHSNWLFCMIAVDTNFNNMYNSLMVRYGILAIFLILVGKLQGFTLWVSCSL